MMIKDNDSLCPVQQIRTFRITRPVCIHHDQCRVGINLIQCQLARDKHVVRIAILRCKTFLQRTQCRIDLINYNLCLFAQLTGRTVNTDSSTKRINVCYLMSHDKEFVTGDHNFAQRQCFHSGLYTGRFVYLTVASAKIRYFISGLYDHLISAASQCQVNGHTGILVILRIIISHITDSHTESDRHLISNLDTFDILQKAEFFLFHFFQIFMLEHDKVLVVLSLFYQTVDGCKKFGHLTVYQCDQQRFLYLFHGIQDFVIIINIYQRRYHLHFLVFNAVPGQLRLIKEIDDL